MKFKITLNKSIAPSDQTGWVQVHDFIPANVDSYISKGRLILLISLVSKDDSISVGNELILGREILTRFHSDYFAKVGGDPFTLLQDAVGKIHKDFKVDLLATIILDTKILLSGAGRVQCWVERLGMIARIIPSNEIFAASGILNDKDVFWIGTDSSFNEIPPETSPQITLKIEKENINFVPPIVNIPESEKIYVPLSISPMRVAIASVIDKVLTILPQKKLYIKEEIGIVDTKKRKKTATLAGAILLFLLIISIVFGMHQQNSQNIKSKYQPILDSAEHNLEEAKNLSSIDTSHASSLILTAKSQIDGLKAQKINDSKINTLSNQIDEALGTVAGLYQENPNLYLDLGLLSSGMKGDDISESENRMAILDRAGKRLVNIDIDTTKSSVVAGPDIMPNAIAVAMYSDRNFVSASDGIWEVGDKAENVIRATPSDKGGDWGNNVLISAYTGNFYVLDKNNSTVWRYQGESGVFGSKANWFGSGIKPDLSKVVSWTIDGNIWLLTSDSKILRFSGGSPVDFSIKSPDKALEANDIFTTQDSKYLYILDRGNSRVLVVDKDGNYKAQYISDNIKSATKIVVSEVSSKIILLEGDKLYSLDIKHL